MARVHRGSVGFVYVALFCEGVKVGFTQRLDRRMRELDARLIASAPGTFVQEQHLIKKLAAHRIDHINPVGGPRESFKPSVLIDLAVAWERMFGAIFPNFEQVA